PFRHRSPGREWTGPADIDLGGCRTPDRDSPVARRRTARQRGRTRGAPRRGQRSPGRAVRKPRHFTRARRAPIRTTSASTSSGACRGASRNQSILIPSRLVDQVPETTPPTSTTVAPRLTGVRCAGGTTWGSAVPGPRTHWSYEGRSRTAVLGEAAS